MINGLIYSSELSNTGVVIQFTIIYGKGLSAYNSKVKNHCGQTDEKREI